MTKNMNINIREYQASDFAACRALRSELTQHHRDIYEDPNIGGRDSGQGFETFQDNSGLANIWIAEVDNKVAGLSGLLINGEEAEIEPVIVTRQFRRQGIGTALIQRIVAEAKMKGILFLGIRPVARNREAISLFVKLGFNILGQVDLFQDLSQNSGRTWKTGIVIHKNKLLY